MQMTTETNAPAVTSPDSAGQPMNDLDVLKAELKWCLENNAGPRTECALRWALELIEDIEKQGEAA